jgi:glycosyltransferase involved in cell wall biosynthesis
MKILVVHNKYQQAGGEDSVFEAEAELLLRHNHSVERLIFDNKEIETGLDKFLSGIRILYNPSSARKIEKRIAFFKPDVIHVHNFIPLASPAVFFVARKNKIPVVATLHNYRLICPSATLFYDGKIYEKSIHSLFPIDAILKGVYRNSRLQTAGLVVMNAYHNFFGTWKNKVDKFIVLTAFARNKFKDSSLRVDDDQFALKPNFVVDPGQSEEVRSDSFLFIGRLSDEKGIDTLLAACKLGDFKLTIIGDGPLREKVERAATLSPNIEYLGFQKKAVIFEKLKTCCALIFPSVWFEGLPITIIEAFATGTPVIGSRIGAVAEIISDNFDGLLFNAGDEHDLIVKINQFKNQTLVKTMSEHSRSTYLRRYTPEKNYAMLIDIYSQAIKRAAYGFGDSATG